MRSDPKYLTQPLRTRPDYGECHGPVEDQPSYCAAVPRGASSQKSNDMSDLKSQLIRLGNANPELRRHIRPLYAALSGQRTANVHREVQRLIGDAEDASARGDRRGAEALLDEALDMADRSRNPQLMKLVHNAMGRLRVSSRSAGKTAAGGSSFAAVYEQWWSQMREKVLRGAAKLRHISPMSITDYSGNGTRYLITDTEGFVKWASLDLRLSGDWRSSKRDPWSVTWEINYETEPTYSNERASRPVKVEGVVEISPGHTPAIVIGLLDRQLKRILKNIT